MPPCSNKLQPCTFPPLCLMASDTPKGNYSCICHAEILRGAQRALTHRCHIRLFVQPTALQCAPTPEVALCTLDGVPVQSVNSSGWMAVQRTPEQRCAASVVAANMKECVVSQVHPQHRIIQ